MTLSEAPVVFAFISASRLRHSGQKPNVHGGYFEGLFSQQLIYRLACLGYNGTVAAYGSEVELGKACEQKQIRMLVSQGCGRAGSVRRPASAGSTDDAADITDDPDGAGASAGNRCRGSESGWHVNR